MNEVHIPKTHMFNARRPAMLILHGTEVDAAKSRAILSGQTEREASAHYLIEEDGKIIQYLDEDLRAWHAGQSYWAGFTDLNSMSIGIELVCLSKDGSFAGEESRYTPPQMTALITLGREIIERHKIPKHHVLAHQDVAPGRRFDPGVYFDWALLAKNGIGLWHDIEMSMETDDVIETDQRRIETFKSDLIAFGYVPRAFDNKKFSEVIIAFQTHFLPWGICGEVTRQSIEVLAVLTKKKQTLA